MFQVINNGYSGHYIRVEDISEVGRFHSDNGLGDFHIVMINGREHIYADDIDKVRAVYRDLLVRLGVEMRT